MSGMFFESRGGITEPSKEREESYGEFSIEMVRNWALKVICRKKEIIVRRKNVGDGTEP